jgi:hypothetical protein
MGIQILGSRAVGCQVFLQKKKHHANIAQNAIILLTANTTATAAITMPSLLQRIRRSFQKHPARNQTTTRSSSPVSVLDFASPGRRSVANNNNIAVVPDLVVLTQERCDDGTPDLTFEEAIQVDGHHGVSNESEEEAFDEEPSLNIHHTTTTTTTNTNTTTNTTTSRNSPCRGEEEEEEETRKDSVETFHYTDPSKVPGNCESMIGQRVQVKNSMKDSLKRNQVGTVTRWKNKSTVELKCDNGRVFGLRVTSIQFVDRTCTQRAATNKDNNEEEDSPTTRRERSRRDPNHAGTQVDDEQPHESVTDDESAETAYYLYPSQVPPRCETIIGRRVQVKDSIKDRKKRNAIGSITRWKNKSTVEMKCEDNGPTSLLFGVKLTSLEFLLGNSSPANREQVVQTEESSPSSTASTTTTTRRHRTLRQVARSVLSTSTNESDAKAGKIRTQRTTRRRVARSVVQSVPTIDSTESFREGESWQVPGNSNDVWRFGDFLVEKMRLRSSSSTTTTKTSETNFLHHLLKHRMLTVDIPLNGRKNQTSFDRKIVDASGQTHDLVCCKIYDDVSGFAMQKSKLARLVYARTEGPELEAFSIQDHLLRIGDFTTLKPRKIAARLELFQSPSGLDIVFLDQSDFQDIPDRGYVGGGFISEDKLVQILVKAGMSLINASRVVAVQVRLFIPSMGVYKGMLVKKRATEAAPIQLPWSMQKVLKSTHPKALQGGAIVICKTGVHPSPGSANEYIGRKLDPTLRGEPPEKSFKSKIKKPLSNMVFRLWQTMGVTKQMCEVYKKESLTTDRRNHAWLVGVPDPTNSLPPDTVFVPGMKTCQFSDIFVTRSPCYAYDHGRKFATITVKPETMSSEDWNWLNNDLNFGVIIFSNPRPGMKSIPERIANGDLDGDLYLVCWDEDILESMAASPLVDGISCDDGKLSTMPSSPSWFDDAQDIMVDAGLSNEIGYLTGKLYKLAEKLADGSESILKDPDANAYYEAYNQALEYKKHGRRITLPSHLIENIPAKLQHLVQSSDA